MARFLFTCCYFSIVFFMSIRVLFVKSRNLILLNRSAKISYECMSVSARFCIVCIRRIFV